MPSHEPAHPVDIVAATDADRVWAAQLMAASDPWITLGRGLDHCLRVCRDPEYLVFVAREAADRCGALILQCRGVAGSPYIVSLVVAPGVRSRGVGAQLLAFAEHEMRAAAHASHLFLCVSSFNVRARRFYERHGYRFIANIEDYSMAGASELLMMKRLTAA